VSDIKVCTEDNSRQSSDIVVCTEDQTQVPSDIKVCTEDGRIFFDKCLGLSDLVISGDEDCNVGDIYTASGGTGNYVFSFNVGTIDQDGEVLSINACGAPDSDRTGIISVFDGCSSASITVRLTGGYWKIISSEQVGSDCSNSPSCNSYVQYGPRGAATCRMTTGSCTGQLLSGGSRVTERVAYAYGGFDSSFDICTTNCCCLGPPITVSYDDGTANYCNSISVGDGFPVSSEGDRTAPYSCGSATTFYRFVVSRESSEWACL
jgi:hypothetical protein